MRDSKLAANLCFLIENCKGNNNATDMKEKRNKSRLFMRDVALYLPKFKEITNSINPCSREKKSSLAAKSASIARSRRDKIRLSQRSSFNSEIIYFWLERSDWGRNDHGAK